MRWGSLLVIVAALLASRVFAAAPDAGPAPAPQVRSTSDAGTAVAKARHDAGTLSEDEQLAADLELLENLEVLERLDQYDVGEVSPEHP